MSEHRFTFSLSDLTRLPNCEVFSVEAWKALQERSLEAQPVDVNIVGPNDEIVATRKAKITMKEVPDRGEIEVEVQFVEPAGRSFMDDFQRPLYKALNPNLDYPCEP